MTVHIAASLHDASEAVIFSDSQASTAVQEYHGEQKLYAGEGFLVGCAGSVAIIRRLFEHLQAQSHVNSTTVADCIAQFLEHNIRPHTVGDIDLLMLTDSGGNGPAIQQFSPSIFKSFGGRETFSSIGSGAEFVYRAFGRDDKNGINHPTDSLPDLFLVSQNFVEAANESLTVDDVHLVGMLRNSRTYLIGHRAVLPRFAPPQLRQVSAWTRVSDEFEQIVAQVEAIRSEVTNAQRTASLIKTGAFDPPRAQQLLVASHAVGLTRAALQSRIDAYCAWYDTLLGR